MITKTHFEAIADDLGDGAIDILNEYKEYKQGAMVKQESRLLESHEATIWRLCTRFKKMNSQFDSGVFLEHINKRIRDAGHQKQLK